MTPQQFATIIIIAGNWIDAYEKDSVIWSGTDEVTVDDFKKLILRTESSAAMSAEIDDLETGALDHMAVTPTKS